jgi:serine/threonine-protein kinase
MIKSATTPARSVASVMPDLPREVIALIDRALEFDRAKRWPDATTMRDAITAAHQAAFRESISSTALSSLVAAGNEAAARTALGAVPSSATPGSVAATVDARGIPETLDATAIARTVPAAPVTKLLGMTTSQPVSTEMPRAATPAVPHSGPKPGRRVGVIVAVAGLLIASASTVGLVVSRRKPPEGSLAPARASEDSALPAFGATGATATIGQPLAPSAVRPDAADVVSIPPTVTAPGGGAPAVATAARTSRGPIAPARSAIPLATTSASPVAPAPPPAPPSRPSCDPPFTIDAAGHRRPKPECI